jgi:hypothetical protein
LIAVPGVGEGVGSLYLWARERAGEERWMRDVCGKCRKFKVVGGSAVFGESRLEAFKTS